MKKLYLMVIGALFHAHGWAATYTFSGPNYNAPTLFTAPCATPTCANFTTAMQQTGSFTTAAPLPANLVNADIANLILSYNFSDGIEHYQSTDGETRLWFAYVFTDAAANITSENINVSRWQTASHAVNDRLNMMSVNIGSFYNQYCQTLASPGICGQGNSDASSSAAFAHGNNNWITNVAPPAVPGAGVASVPTLSQWGVWVLSLLMVCAVWWRSRRLPARRRIKGSVFLR